MLIKNNIILTCKSCIEGNWSPASLSIKLIYRKGFYSSLPQEKPHRLSIDWDLLALGLWRRRDGKANARDQLVYTPFSRVFIHTCLSQSNCGDEQKQNSNQCLLCYFCLLNLSLAHVKAVTLSKYSCPFPLPKVFHSFPDLFPLSFPGCILQEGASKSC